MDPFTGVALGVGFLFDLFGAVEAAKKRGMAEDAARRAVAEAYGLEVPELDQLMIQAEQMGGRPDVMASDQRAAELDALRQMSEMGARGGMDEGSIAAMQQAGAKAAQANQQARQSIANQYQQRGQWGSGNELASQLAAAQSSANTLSLAGTQAAADARQRALQAIAGSGNMASRARSADEQLALANKEAAEARDKFNTTIRNEANQFNANAPVKQFQMGLGRQGAIQNATNTQVNTLTGNSKSGQEDINRLGARGQNFIGGFSE
jgi:hypothetical protein